MGSILSKDLEIGPIRLVGYSLQERELDLFASIKDISYDMDLVLYALTLPPASSTAAQQITPQTEATKNVNDEPTTIHSTGSIAKPVCTNWCNRGIEAKIIYVIIPCEVSLARSFIICWGDVGSDGS
jgi:hypothetical protein